MKKIVFILSLIFVSCSMHGVNNNLVNKTALNFRLTMLASQLHKNLEDIKNNPLRLIGTSKSTIKQYVDLQKVIQSKIDTLNTSKLVQRVKSIVGSVINNSNLYYKVINLDDNSEKNIINPGTTALHLPLNVKGYELRPYQNKRNGVLVDPITAEENVNLYNRVGGTITIDAQALDNTGISVAQGATPLDSLQPRSHAVSLWPNLITEGTFLVGMPAEITINLDYLDSVPDLVFPRVSKIVRKGIELFTSIFKNSVSFNRALMKTNFTVATLNVTKDNSVTSSNYSIPTGGDSAWLWSDVPNS